MPSDEPIPTVQDFLDAYEGELAGNRDLLADTRRGSGYDVWNGVNSILWVRQANRDRDIFRAIYFDTAEDRQLEIIGEERYDIERIQSSRGIGETVVERPAAGAAGTFLVGTRIEVVKPGASTVRSYRLTQETPYTAAELKIRLAVEALEPGPDTAIDTTQEPGLVLRFGDPIEDPDFVINEVVCAAGTDRENNDAYRARIREERAALRVGYVHSITEACVEAGAVQVALFSSDYLGTSVDHGLNRCFVGDANFETTEELLDACRIAVDSVRVAGADMTVFGMTNEPTIVRVDVRFWESPGNFDLVQSEKDVRAAVLNYFDTRENPFYFRIDGIAARVLRAIRNTQEVTVDTFPVEPTLATLFDTVPIKRHVPKPLFLAPLVPVTFKGPDDP